MDTCKWSSWSRQCIINLAQQTYWNERNHALKWLSGRDLERLVSTYHASHIIFIALSDLDSMLLINKRAWGSIRPVFNHSIVNATITMKKMPLLNCLLLNYESMSFIGNCNRWKQKSRTYSWGFLVSQWPIPSSKWNVSVDTLVGPLPGEHECECTSCNDHIFYLFILSYRARLSYLITAPVLSLLSIYGCGLVSS